jgi:energy-coupling factor transporter ATP-binding protein EcfA2
VEDMTEKLWYLEFGLKENAFAHADKKTEKTSIEYYEIVETEATKMVKTLVGSKGRSIVHGPKGCGKSTALLSVRPLFMKPITVEDEEVEDEAFPIVIGSNSTTELVQDLLSWGLYRLTEKDKKILDTYSSQLRGCIDPFIPPKKDAHFPTKYICYFRGCPIKRRCDFPVFESGVTFNNVVNCLPKKGFCPLAEWAVPLVFKMLKVNTFLLDVPDEIGHETPPIYFKNFISNLCDETNAAIILMATLEQYRALTRATELFARWNHRNFPPISDVEMKVIYESRLASCRDESSPIKFQNPLTTGALEYIILNSHHNPRSMIKNVCLILERMWEKGFKESVDVDFVQKMLQNVGGVVSEDETLSAIVEEFKATGVRKVGAKEILERWRERDPDIRLGEKNVGWAMKRIGYKRQPGPLAMYQIQ